MIEMIENVAKPNASSNETDKKPQFPITFYGIDFSNDDIREYFEKLTGSPVDCDLSGVAVVSPLGPQALHEEQNRAGRNMNPESRTVYLRDALSKASTSVSKLADTFKECTPLNTPKVLEALNSPNNQTTITFQHDPAEGIERFKLIAVKNVLDFYSLPMLYLYGRASFYVTGDLNSINKCLTVRYEGVTRKYVIGKSVVEKKELAWIIKTMKIGGECLVEVNKKVKKASLKAGKTFTVTI